MNSNNNARLTSMSESEDERDGRSSTIVINNSQVNSDSGNQRSNSTFSSRLLIFSRKSTNSSHSYMTANDIQAVMMASSELIVNNTHSHNDESDHINHIVDDDDDNNNNNNIDIINNNNSNNNIFASNNEIKNLDCNDDKSNNNVNDLDDHIECKVKLKRQKNDMQTESDDPNTIPLNNNNSSILRAMKPSILSLEGIPGIRSDSFKSKNNKDIIANSEDNYSYHDAVNDKIRICSGDLELECMANLRTYTPPHSAAGRQFVS